MTQIAKYKAHGNASQFVHDLSVQKTKLNAKEIKQAIEEESESLHYFSKSDPGWLLNDTALEITANAYWKQLDVEMQALSLSHLKINKKQKRSI